PQDRLPVIVFVFLVRRLVHPLVPLLAMAPTRCMLRLSLRVAIHVDGVRLDQFPEPVPVRLLATARLLPLPVADDAMRRGFLALAHPKNSSWSMNSIPQRAAK